MKFSRFVLAAALAIGLGGAASATPLPAAADMIRPDTAVTFVKWRGHKGWKGHRGHHYGWYRGHHRGWYRPHRRVYYTPPRRHYGWYRGRHYGWHHRRPRHAVYFRF